MKKISSAFAAVAMAFTLTHSGFAMAEGESADGANMSEAAPTDDMYADFAKTVDAQFRPPGGGGHGGPGGGGPGGGPGGPGHGGGPGGPGGGGHGGGPGGPGGGHGPGRPRQVTCYAYDRRGDVFQGDGWSVGEAAREAGARCERFSRTRRPNCRVDYNRCR